MDFREEGNVIITSSAKQFADLYFTMISFCLTSRYWKKHFFFQYRLFSTCFFNWI